MRHFAIAVLCLLGACTAPLTPQQQSLVSGVETVGTTLATVAAENNTTAAALVNKGVTLCGDAVSPLGVLAADGIEAAANAADVPTAVTGMASKAVADTCSALGKVAGALPPSVDPATVPVVIAPATTLPAVTALPVS